METQKTLSSQNNPEKEAEAEAADSSSQSTPHNYNDQNTLAPAQKQTHGDFPHRPEVNTLPANAGDMGSTPGLGRFRMPRCC